MGVAMRPRLGAGLGHLTLCAACVQSRAGASAAHPCSAAALPQSCREEFSPAQCPSPPSIPQGQDRGKTQVTWALALGVVQSRVDPEGE